MPLSQHKQQGNVKTYQQKYIRCMFSAGSHITDYHYNKILIVKDKLILEIVIHY